MPYQIATIGGLLDNVPSLPIDPSWIPKPSAPSAPSSSSEAAFPMPVLVVGVFGGALLGFGIALLVLRR